MEFKVIALVEKKSIFNKILEIYFSPPWLQKEALLYRKMQIELYAKVIPTRDIYKHEVRPRIRAQKLRTRDEIINEFITLTKGHEMVNLFGLIVMLIGYMHSSFEEQSPLLIDRSFLLIALVWFLPAILLQRTNRAKFLEKLNKDKPGV